MPHELKDPLHPLEIHFEKDLEVCFGAIICRTCATRKQRTRHSMDIIPIGNCSIAACDGCSSVDFVDNVSPLLKIDFL